MKYTVAAILAAAVLAITPAAAQQHQESHPSAHPAPAMHAAPAPAMHAMHPSTHMAVHHATMHSAVHHHLTTHHVRHVISHHRHAVVHHVVRAATRPGFHRASPAAVAKLRRNVVAVHRFHAGPYRAPPGWHYRRWVFGERLPALYFGPSFWISDFIAFDLFPPPDGFVWVRFGPDALLIDRYTGEIIQVDYGVFF